MAKYLPRGTTICQARGLSKETIADIFEHIGSRQKNHGAEDAFRFKSIKKGNQFVPAKYREADAEAEGGQEGNSGATTGRTRGRQQPAQVIVAAAAQSEPNAEPGPEPESAAEPERAIGAGLPEPNVPANERVIVFQDMAERLQAAGCPNLIPFNGPADGPPQYAIPHNTYKAYEAIIQQSTLSSSNAMPRGNQPCIDPNLLSADMPTPRPSPSPMPMPRPNRIQPGRKGKAKETLIHSQRRSGR
jgi:hypothetical protein